MPSSCLFFGRRTSAGAHWLVGILAVLGAVGATSVRGQAMAPGYSDDFMVLDAREVRLLPPYCLHAQYFTKVYGYNEVEQARWRAALGPAFVHIHHYCFGQLKTNRALFHAQEKRFREYYLRDSIEEFNYVIQRVPTDFVLLPEILMKKGENLVRLGRGDKAMLEFERAIELNPSFWPPYAQLADYYSTSGEKDKARDVLTKGLTNAPETPALKRRLNELGPVAVRGK